MARNRNKLQRSVRSDPVELAAKYLGEPSLRFCGGREHVSQVHGIASFGPHSLDAGRHPNHVRVGLIGSGKSIASARSWLRSCADGVKGEDDLPDFPGYRADRGFFSELVFDDDLVETLTTHEIADATSPRLRKDRFENVVKLIGDKTRLLSQRDSPPTYLVLAIPDDLLGDFRAIDFVDPELGAVHRDLRRALKAELMRYRIPTQILLQRVAEALPGAKDVDHKSRCAWNFFTGMYFKAGGVPWSPCNLEPGTCFVGVSFYRPLGSGSNRIRTSVAQAFDEHGDGIVLRGQDFAWDEDKFGKSPHLDRDSASALINMVLDRYTAEMKQAPKRVVIHKTSRFWNDEREGFQEALRSVRHIDLLAVTPTSDIRLLRAGQYPPLRSTRFRLGDISYLYTTGFLSPLKAYPHGHVPSPLQIADHVGDTDLDQLLWELLVLSKMNWNSAGFAGLMPITIRFSRLVGDIMREIPQEREPEPQFRYYI